MIVDEGYKQLQIALSMHRNLLNDSANALHNGFGDKTLQQYQKAIYLMRDRLIMSSVNFDFYTMIVGAATVWLVSACCLVKYFLFSFRLCAD